MSDEVKKEEPTELTKEFVSGEYWDCVLINNAPPTSVYSFCKSLTISERKFYKLYSSFEAIEKEFWAQLISETYQLLNEDADYQSYDFKGKMLAFFYTFFEKALEHRSKFLVRFPAKHHALCSKTLGEMRHEFTEVVKEIAQTSGQQSVALVPAKLIEESYRGAWPTLLYVIEFWRHDTSEGFQDTDSLIEKVVKLGDELTNFSIVEAAVDLAKFALGRGK